MTSLVLGDLILESLTPSVNAPQDKSKLVIKHDQLYISLLPYTVNGFWHYIKLFSNFLISFQ